VCGKRDYKKKGKELFNWVARYKSEIMMENMLKPVRRRAPPPPPTNRVESLNSLLKLETNGPLPINECERVS